VLASSAFAKAVFSAQATEFRLLTAPPYAFRSPNHRRSALGGAEEFLLPPREQDVAQRRAVVRSVDGQAKTVEHRGLLVRKLDSDVFELTGSRGRLTRRS
jgi:hypothetical protein